MASQTVDIDLNVRVRGGQTFSGFEDVSPDASALSVGDKVGLTCDNLPIIGEATVADLDHEKRLIYLSVPWGDLRFPEDD